MTRIQRLGPPVRQFENPLVEVVVISTRRFVMLALFFTRLLQLNGNNIRKDPVNYLCGLERYSQWEPNTFKTMVGTCVVLPEGTVATALPGRVSVMEWGLTPSRPHIAVICHKRLNI